MFNFKTSIRNGDRFYRAHCTRLDLFGLVSSGIFADALRLSYMPDLSKPQRGQLFVQSVDDAAAYLAGLLKAEVGENRLADLRRAFASCPDHFAAYEITVPGDNWVGEKCFSLAFEYASGGRPLDMGANESDTIFAERLWEVFAEAFFAEAAEP